MFFPLSRTFIQLYAMKLFPCNVFGLGELFNRDAQCIYPVTVAWQLRNDFLQMSRSPNDFVSSDHRLECERATVTWAHWMHRILMLKNIDRQLNRREWWRICKMLNSFWTEMFIWLMIGMRARTLNVKFGGFVQICAEAILRCTMSRRQIQGSARL